MSWARNSAIEAANTTRKPKIRWAGLLCVGILAALSAPSSSAAGVHPEAGSAILASAAKAGGAVAVPEKEEHGPSEKAGQIGRVYGFPITDSMLTSWIVALGLILFARAATRRMRQVPGGAQNFLEWIVEGLYGLLEGILGPHLV